jgi:hypothetical protein
METIKPKTTPKDFFLWLAAMVTLYVSAVSLILLAHQYIDIYFPNQLLTYGDPYSGAIRFAIASLLVMYPLFVWIMWVLHKDIRLNPEKKEIWVRRWLVFLTLFIAGLAMAIDVISVVYVYLQGDLAVRFVLKALTILLVLGAGFWYYLEELKGTWESKAGLSKSVGAIVSLVVLATVVASFFIIGSPESARLMKLDDQKVMDLQNIQYQVLNYWQQKEKLPGALSDLEDPLSGFVAPKDPQSGEAYVYKPGEGMSFSLCATFNKPSRGSEGDTTRPAMPIGDVYNENWLHEAGEKCFERIIDPERYPPYTKKTF